MKYDILTIIHSAPYSSSRAKEGLDYILTCSAYDQKIAILFIDEGRQCLRAAQDSNLLQQKNFSKQLSALELYGIEDIFCENLDFTPAINCHSCNPAQIKELLQNSKHLVNF